MISELSSNVRKGVFYWEKGFVFIFFFAECGRSGSWEYCVMRCMMEGA